MSYSGLKDRKRHEEDAARIRELEAQLKRERATKAAKERIDDVTPVGHVTIEKTSKALKAQILISSVITAIGVFSMAVLPIIGAVTFVIGLVWFCAVKFSIWWHHG